MTVHEYDGKKNQCGLRVRLARLEMELTQQELAETTSPKRD